MPGIILRLRVENLLLMYGAGHLLLKDVEVQLGSSAASDALVIKHSHIFIHFDSNFNGR